MNTFQKKGRGKIAKKRSESPVHREKKRELSGEKMKKLRSEGLIQLPQGWKRGGGRSPFFWRKGNWKKIPFSERRE